MRLQSSRFLFLVLISALAAAPALIGAQEAASNQAPTTGRTLSAASAPREGSEPHAFWDKTNVMLFAGVAAARALDYTSTRHFRSMGANEALLSNNIVDNKPLFAGIEAAGTALSIGVSYWLHRTGHHKLERWVSVVHIGVGGFGDIRNYSLRPSP